jgi:hypothetical protein
MSDDLNELLETKPEGNKPKSPETPKPVVISKPPTPQENTTPAQPTVSLEDVEVVYSPSRVTNYKTLKALGAILKTFAYGSGIGGIISIVIALGNAGSTDRFGRYVGLGAEFYLFLIIGVMGIFTALPFAFLSESINVILDIEANSRQAAKTLGRILKAQ